MTPIALFTLWVSTSCWNHKMFSFCDSLFCVNNLVPPSTLRSIYPFFWVNFSVVKNHFVNDWDKSCSLPVWHSLASIAVNPAVPAQIPMAILPKASITFLNCAFSISHILDYLHAKYAESISIYDSPWPSNFFPVFNNPYCAHFSAEHVHVPVMINKHVRVKDFQIFLCCT